MRDVRITRMNLLLQHLPFTHKMCHTQRLRQTDIIDRLSVWAINSSAGSGPIDKSSYALQTNTQKPTVQCIVQCTCVTDASSASPPLDVFTFLRKQHNVVLEDLGDQLTPYKR